ncbi:type II toxin-antitoxin system VapB family antitoxin [Rhizobium jaguaris]|nr:type II toxin-antitoxin system VapB family antitoxin [Rhizobium jaguaris]
MRVGPASKLDIWGIHFASTHQLVELAVTMLQLTYDTEQLARRVAARLGRKPEDLIRAALEREAKALGVSDELPAKRRMTATEMLAFGRKVAARPVLDPRTPQEIADDLNAL